MLTVSVVIPTLNEEHNIGELLDLLEHQTRVPDEIIVVDESEDRTAEIVSSFSQKYSNVYLIKNKDYSRFSGVNAARHVGTLYASSDIVIQTDADAVPTNDWIERIVAKFEADEELVGLTGSVKDYKNRYFDELTCLFANFIFQGMGNNTAYRKEAYMKTEGYNEALALNQGGDIIFWNSLKTVGKCEYDPTMVIGHKSGYKWRVVGLSITEAILVVSGFFTRLLNKRFGDSLLGASAGLGLAEAGSVIVGVEEINEEEEKLNFTGIHHDIWGIIGIIATLLLDKTNIIKNKEITSFLYGMCISIIIHHFLTEVEGCTKGLCLIKKSG